jgi:hypothetical protein
VDRYRVCCGLDIEDESLAGGRPDQIEEHADGSGLARAIGTEETEDLSLLDFEVDLDDAAMDAVRLGQLLGLDDGDH